MMTSFLIMVICWWAIIFINWLMWCSCESLVTRLMMTFCCCCYDCWEIYAFSLIYCLTIWILLLADFMSSSAYVIMEGPNFLNFFSCFTLFLLMVIILMHISHAYLSFHSLFSSSIVQYYYFPSFTLYIMPFITQIAPSDSIVTF